MNHFQKLQKPFLLKWVSSNLHQNYHRSSTSLLPLCFQIANCPTYYTSRAEENTENDYILIDKKQKQKQIPNYRNVYLKEAQSSLLHYFHDTRNLPFNDAEHMTKNCPVFIDKLLKKVEGENDIEHSLAKYFRYHPINEFESFFESIGLSPSEINQVLPRDLMFLNDDDLLIDNYHVLCDYGIPRSMIGKIYMEAREVFKYDYGVLYSKLRAYEDLGLNHNSVTKVIVSSGSFLIGSVNGDFVKLLDLLRSSEIEFRWIEGRLSHKNSYNWSRMLEFFSFISEIGYSKEKLRTLMRRHPQLLVEDSGRTAFKLVGILIKMGSTGKEISSFLLQFPRVQIGTFVKNLRQCLLFLIEIEMDANDINKIAREHPLLLGFCSLKKPNSILSILNVGKKRICNVIKEDPNQLKNWVMGLKVEPLPNSGDGQKSLMQKSEFLLNVGFIENSEKFNKALKVFRGKGGELQERFDCFVKAGLDRKDVTDMIKVAPQILNQTKHMIEQKIDFLVNGMCYPISSLVAFPQFICYTVERAKLRVAMYTWLKDEGLASPKLALSTILACSENAFVTKFIKNHPGGLEVWENLKKQDFV
ncbi:hypothetical protein AQUCO_07500021v1 [Aquilegia coerulea]|uniref:Transcription termination factor MTEF18, mitochondrial-like n=1 Tax=Aquilegia coerulea TaxID=218851 RepID=A0A2G5C954_AQUCA|nr:hypothetical protein AQUCO_07500021v1 [Aquilegia coerulea]